VFPMILPAKFIVRSMHEDCWIECFRSGAPIFFIIPFGFRGNGLKLCWLLILWSSFSAHGAGGEGHEKRGRWKSNGGQILVVRCNWLGAL
jgi:hypothetical protein